MELASLYKLDSDFVYIPYECKYENYLIVMYKIQNETIHNLFFKGYYIANNKRFHIARIINLTKKKCVIYCDHFIVGSTQYIEKIRYWTNPETAIMRLYLHFEEKMDYDEFGNIKYKKTILPNNMELHECYSHPDVLLLLTRCSKHANKLIGLQQVLYGKKKLIQRGNKAIYNATTGDFQFISEMYKIIGNVKSGVFNWKDENKKFLFKNIQIDKTKEGQWWKFWPDQIFKLMSEVQASIFFASRPK